MSYQGGGAVVGVGVGVALAGGAAIVAGAGLLLAGKVTVLTAKGVMHVGKKLKDAYDEHEKKVAERLERQAHASERLQELDDALSETETEIGDLNQALENPEDSGAEEYARFRARQLRSRRRAFARERSAAQILEAELKEAASRLQMVREQRPEAGNADIQVGGEFEQNITSREKTLQDQIRGIEERLEEYQTLKDRMTAESRARVLEQARKILDSLNGDEGLENRLGELERGGTLLECEEFLKQLYKERQQHSKDHLETHQQTKALGMGILKARLELENLRCLSGGEKDDIDKFLDRADDALDAGNLRNAEKQLSNAEKVLSKARQRDIGDWVTQEEVAMQVLGEARVLMAALEEDEGMLAVLEAEGKRNDLQKIRESLETAGQLLSHGDFDTVTRLAEERAKALRGLRDAALEAVNSERIKALGNIAREAMQARGFTDITVAPERGGWVVEGRRDQTPFWVKIDEDGEFFFDLGKSGFSSQQACTEEIDAFLSELQKRGAILDIDVRIPTLEKEQDAVAAGADARQREEARLRAMRSRTGLRNTE